MTQTFSCIACGAPNEPETNASRMACTFCGTNLTIPEHLRTKPQPKIEKNFKKTESSRPVEIEAVEVLRKSQPIAIRAWNLFAAWTWLRWLIPTCLTIFIFGMIACVIFGVLPFIIK
jgi:DNA-directed RNA polymerase subunit RPC12/RpoP